MNKDKKVTVPDLITVLNASLGFISITYINDGRFWIASALIIVCVGLDGLDGALARYMKSEHELGAYLDFFADVISFCFAPALLLYATYYDETLGRGWESPQNALATLIPFILVFLGTLRLARFADERAEKNTYKGLPTPCLALLVVHLSYLLGWGETGYFAPYQALMIVGGMSILLYVPVRYLKIRRKILFTGGASLLILILGGLLLSRSSSGLSTFVLIFTTSVLLGYVFISPLIVESEE